MKRGMYWSGGGRRTHDFMEPSTTPTHTSPTASEAQTGSGQHLIEAFVVRIFGGGGGASLGVALGSMMFSFEMLQPRSTFA